MAVQRDSFKSEKGEKDKSINIIRVSEGEERNGENAIQRRKGKGPLDGSWVPRTFVF